MKQSKDIINRKKKYRLRIKFKLFLNIFALTLFFIPCFFFATKTFEKEKTTPINFTDTNDVKYKVYLNKNDIYHDEYLGMNRAYVANLINYFDIDFNYTFNIDNAMNMEFDYKIIANLIIENKNGTNYVDEEYIIKDSTKKSINKCRNYTINENVIIDYGYYNNLANKFKNQTGIDVNSFLNVYMLINKKTIDDNNYNIDDNSYLIIKIPLSERAIEITLDSSSQNITKQVTPKLKVKFNIKYLILGIVFFIIDCIFVIRAMMYSNMLVRKKTPYDKYVSKILKDYDRLIVETKTIIKFDNYNIIDVNSFNELLDVRDNLKLPIIYNSIVKHEAGIFYIKNNLDIYRFIVDGDELEKQKL